MRIRNSTALGFNRFAQPWEERDVDPLDEYMSPSSSSSEDDMCDSSEKPAVRAICPVDMHKSRSCIDLQRRDAAGKELSKHYSVGAMLKHGGHGIGTGIINNDIHKYTPVNSASISNNESTPIGPDEAQNQTLLKRQRRECRR